MYPIFIVTISFFLEGIVSNFVSSSTYFFPLFTLVSFIIIYPYFQNKDEGFFKICLITGIFYDLIYTDTFLVHTLLFFILAFVIQKINVWLANNFFNSAIMAFFLIVIYRLLQYSILFLCGYFPYSFSWFITSITHSLILNIFYAIILFFVTDFISYKKHITKIN